MHRYVYADVDTTDPNVVREIVLATGYADACWLCLHVRRAGAGAVDGASVGAFLRYAERLICSFTDVFEALH